MRRLRLLAILIVATLATFSLQAADDDIPRASVTYFGGTGADGASRIATDAGGNAYVLGTIGSTRGVTPAFATTGNHLLKFNASNELQWAVPLSGRVYDVAATPDGSAFVLASRTATAGIFVTRVAATGATVYTTDVPGLTIDMNTWERPAIAVSRSGEVAVSGRSDSTTFAVPSTVIGPVAGENAVVVMLDARGAPSSATVIGGSAADVAADVAIDAAGDIYLAGRTRSADFPVSPRAAQTPGGNCRVPPSPDYAVECDDAFLVKLDARGQPVFATRYGGSKTDYASAVAVDRAGGIFVAGWASSRDFPLVHPLATSYVCPADPFASCPGTFVMRFDRTGSRVEFATYVRGTRSTAIHGLAVDVNGNVYVAGTNSGNDLPMQRAPQPDNGAGPVLVSADGARTWAAASGLRANMISEIAWTTTTPVVAYAASDRGLFVSTDLGRSWNRAAGLPSVSVFAVAVDPVTPAIVYAAVGPDPYSPPPPSAPRGLIKSLDGGRSWTTINNGISDADRFVRSIAIAHSQPWTVYVVAGSHIYASDDGGSNWREGAPGVGDTVAVHPANPSIVYTAARTVFRVSTDGARTWRTTWSRTDRSGLRAGRVLVNPTRPAEVVVPTEFGVVRSLDSGETWQPIGLGEIEGPFPAAVDPAAPGDIWIGWRSLGRIRDGSSMITTVDSRVHFVYYLSARHGRLLLSQGFAVNGFVTALDPSGNLLWSTYLGGDAHGDGVADVAADSMSVRVVGNTGSDAWPLAQAGPRPYGGSGDLFLARFLIPR